jgi:ribosomal protein S18 acetylase RimI-like enzyme
MALQTLPLTLDLPAFPTLPGFEFRTPRHADIPALYDLMLAVERADDRDMVSTLADYTREFDDPWCRPETDALLAVTLDGRLAGIARTFQSPQPEDEARCFFMVEVQPAQRDTGVEESLLEWAEARGRQRTLVVAGDVPRLLRSGQPDNLTHRCAQLEQRGFSVVRYFNRMQRDLNEPIPTVQLPAGLTLRPFTPDLNDRVLAAFNEAFRDHWSFEPTSADEWQQFFVERTSFRPDLSAVVMDGEDVAGFSLNSISPEENARHNRSEGWVEELAVRRPWRKRGMATAMLYAAMHAFKVEGLRHAMLGVDTENLTGALRVYENAGFKPIKRYVQYQKRVEV